MNQTDCLNKKREEKPEIQWVYHRFPSSNAVSWTAESCTCTADSRGSARKAGQRPKNIPCSTLGVACDTSFTGSLDLCAVAMAASTQLDDLSFPKADTMYITLPVFQIFEYSMINHRSCSTCLMYKKRLLIISDINLKLKYGNYIHLILIHHITWFT